MRSPRFVARGERTLRLLTVGSLPPEWGGAARGGVATFHSALLEGLHRWGKGIEVAGVLAPSAGDPTAPVPVFHRPEGVSIASFYEELLERLAPDVVLMNHIAHTVGVTHSGLAAAPPAVGVVHSWHSITFAAGEEERARARGVTERALAGLAGMVVPSGHCLEEGESLGLPVPPGTEVIHYPLQPLYLESGIEVRGEERCGALYVGSLIERKNPLGLVEAAALDRGVDVTFVGTGECEARLRELSESPLLRGRVRLAELPAQGHLQALRRLFLRTEVLCLPSRSESFGIVFIEALACGTPVVGFGPTVREIADTLGMEIGYPLQGGDPEEIAEAIRQVRSRRWDREALRRGAVTAFGLERVTRAYVDTLEAHR